MARTVIPIQTTTRIAASANVTWQSADGVNSHEFDNSSEKVFLVLRNTNAGTHIVNIKRPATVDGATLADLSVTVPANTGFMVLGPFPKGIYNQTGDKVYVDVPVTPTALSLGLLRLGTLS
jgi:hypothetical protein